jgi:hypothetical protein
MVQLAQCVYFIKTGNFGGKKRCYFLDHCTRIAFIFILSIVSGCLAKGSCVLSGLDRPALE